MTLGERIKLVRKSNKMNQTDFASRLGISQTHVSKIEKDIEKPSETLLILIEHQFNINIEWLKKEEGTAEKYIEWDDSDSGFEVKYMHFRETADELINLYKGSDRQYFVEAFCYFITLMSTPELDEQEKSQFLKSIHALTDKLEHFQFQSCVCSKTNRNKNNIDYKYLLNNVIEFYNLKKEIIFSIDEMLNIYLSKFNLSC